MPLARGAAQQERGQAYAGRPAGQALQEPGALLRLELDLDDYQLPVIAGLPWEMLRAPQDRNVQLIQLATHPILAISRRRELWKPAAPIRVEEPLRMLLVVTGGLLPTLSVTRSLAM